MIDLRRAIEPGKAAAGLAIGDRVASVLHPQAPVHVEQVADEELFDFGSVRVWAQAGIIKQIGVRLGYAGCIAGTEISIGSTLQEVVNAIGPVAEDDEDNLVVPRLPGMCFETTNWRSGPEGWTIERNLDARLMEIFVYAESASKLTARRLFNSYPDSYGLDWERDGC